LQSLLRGSVKGRITAAAGNPHIGNPAAGIQLDLERHLQPGGSSRRASPVSRNLRADHANILVILLTATAATHSTRPAGTGSVPLLVGAQRLPRLASRGSRGACGPGFLLALFLAPLVALVPSAATSAALIIVGVLMMQSVKEIDFSDMVYAIPAFLTITFMPFTYNIANGISFGIVSYVVLASVANLSGKAEKGKYTVHWLMWVLAVLIVARYVFMGAA